MLTLTAPGEGTDLEAWNEAAPAMWNHFATVVKRDVRAMGGRLHFMKTYEYQKRGALHIHALVRVEGMRRKTLVPIVKQARTRAGFGKQYRLDQADEKAAGYMAKYVAKQAHEMPRGCGRRVWSCSRSWGSMRALRQRQAAWAASQGRAALAESQCGQTAAGEAVGRALDHNTEISTGSAIIDHLADGIAM